MRNNRTSTPTPPPVSVHRVTHITGRRVTCSCGWATPGAVADQAAGQLIGEAHVRKQVSQ